MPYRVTCPSCRTVYLVSEDSLGRKFQCKKCQQPFLAGEAKAPLPSADKPAAPTRPNTAGTQPNSTVKAPLRPATTQPPATSANPAMSPKKAPRRLFGPLVGASLFLGGVGVGIAVSFFFFRTPQAAAPVVQAAPTNGVQGVTNTSSSKKGEQEANTKPVSLAPDESPSKTAPTTEKPPAPTDTSPPPAQTAQGQPDPPVADRTELPRAAEVGKPFKYQLSHPTQKARSYTLHSGPKGLKISKEGLVQWTPEAGQEGTHRLLVGIVTDKMSGANIYTVRVNDAGAATLKPLPADLDLVPSKETIFLSVHPADLWKDPALASIRKLVLTNPIFAAALARLKQGTGLDPGDIQRAVIIFWGKQHDPNSVALVTTVKSFDRPRILGMIGEGPRTEKINGKSVMSSPRSEFALHLLNERTFLYGRAVEVTRILEQPSRTTRSASWNGILHSASQHALLIGIQHDIFAEDPKKQLPLPLKMLTPLLDAQTAMASLDAGKDLHLTVRLMFAGGEQAKVAEGAAREGLKVAAMFLNQFAEQFKKQAPGQLPPPFDKLVAGAQAAEASLKKATIQVKDRALECQAKVQSSDQVEAVAAAAMFFFAPRPTKPGAAPPGPPPAPPPGPPPTPRKIEPPKTDK